MFGIRLSIHLGLSVSIWRLTEWTVDYDGAVWYLALPQLYRVQRAHILA